HHPFNVRMNNGLLTPRQIRGWVANRFYYQISIPIKDAAMLSNCPDRSVRREWIQRILDHDGHGQDAGGIEAWIQLGEAVGIARAEMTSLQNVVPGVRFAVDAYVNPALQARRAVEHARCDPDRVSRRGAIGGGSAAWLRLRWTRSPYCARCIDCSGRRLSRPGCCFIRRAWYA